MQNHLEAASTEIRFHRARRGRAAVSSYQFLRIVAVHVVNLQPIVLTELEPKFEKDIYKSFIRRTRMFCFARHSPVMSDCDVETFRSDLEMIKDKSDLLVRRRHEEVRAISVAWIIAGVSRRIELAPLAGIAAIGEVTGAVGRRGARDLVFRFEGVPLANGRNQSDSNANRNRQILSLRRNFNY